jgi:anti-anti-sigma factor
MEIEPEHGVVALKGMRELSAASIRAFREAAVVAAKSGLPIIEIDLSQVNSMDARSLGVLAAMYRLVSARAPLGTAPVRLLNPQPAVQQMLELAKMDLLFEIVTNPSSAAALRRVDPARRPASETVSHADLLEAA